MGIYGIEDLKPFATPINHSVHRAGRKFWLQCGNDLIAECEMTLEQLTENPTMAITWMQETMLTHRPNCKLGDNDGSAQPTKLADGGNDRQGSGNSGGSVELDGS